MIQKTPKEEKKPLAHDHIDLKPNQGQLQDGEHYFNINSNIYCMDINGTKKMGPLINQCAF